MTSKNTLAAATLVAAVPAAVLGFSLVGSFLTGLTELSKKPMLLSLYAVTLLCCAGVVFLPVAVLIFGPKAPAKRERKEGSSELVERGSQDQEADEEAEGQSDEEEVAAKPKSTGELDVVDAEPTSTGDLDVVDAEPTSTGDLEVVDDEFGTQEYEADEAPKSDAEVEGFSDDDFAFDDELDEEKPPKKKKGK